MMRKDPICGGTIDPQLARHKSEHSGFEYYFCSEACQQKFEERPEYYRGQHPA